MLFLSTEESSLLQAWRVRIKEADEASGCPGALWRIASSTLLTPVANTAEVFSVELLWREWT